MCGQLSYVVNHMRLLQWHGRIVIHEQATFQIVNETVIRIFRQSHVLHF